MRKAKNKDTNKIDAHFVGDIQLKNEVYVTDPCYDNMVWYSELLTNVSPGTYKCFTVETYEGAWGNRVAELHAIKEDVYNKYLVLEMIPYESEPLDCIIGVDSGQCGIFDADYYEEHQPDDDYFNENSWYRKVCDLTDNEGNAGIIDNLGVNSSSGYGDGAYDLWVAKNDKGEIIAMKVIFIAREED